MRPGLFSALRRAGGRWRRHQHVPDRATGSKGFGLGHAVLSVYGLAFVASITLSALVYWQGRAAVEATARLVDDDIPTLWALAELKSDVTSIEPVIHQYFLLLDRPAFLRDMAAAESSVERSLAAVRLAFPGDRRTEDIAAKYGPIVTRVDRLAELLQASPIDWGRARGVASEISAHCMAINDDINRLAASVRDEVSLRGDAAQRTIEGIARLVAGFSALLFVVVSIGGGYARAYLSEGAARRRLTLFPERNPHPVLRLARDGAVRYANPGAMATLAALGASARGAEALLPGDLGLRLDAMVEAGQDRDRYEYAALGRIFACALHYLEDFGEFHAYLADITETKQAEQKLAYFAYHDLLTGLPNRRRLLESLTWHAGEGVRTAILLVSLDRFRLVTESLGHAAGDRLLVAAGQRLAGLVESPPDGIGDATLHRFESELFAILATGFDRSDAPARFASRVVSSMETPLQVDERELFGSVSIGIAVSPSDGRDADVLMRNAESALHQMVLEGGDGFRECSTVICQSALQRLDMESALRRAMTEDRLELHYQPQMEIGSGRLVGVEALLRWNDPALGPVPPDRFIPLAEETGLIIPLGEWVLRTACAQAKAWQDAGAPPMVVAVNLSARQFRGPPLAETIARVLRETGLAPGGLELEVTESVAMHEIDATIAALKALKAIGVRLAIDDFGTGYSSLAYLKRFPVDKLKVDRSFVRSMESEPGDAAIVRSVIALGHALDLRVIAEGVETAAQFALLRDLDCDEIQGYHLSPPLPVAAITALLTTRIPDAALAS